MGTINKAEIKPCDRLSNTRWPTKMKPNFIKSNVKRRIIKELEDIYGIDKLSYLFLESGKKKLRAFSGHLSKEEILQLSGLTNIELIGLYMISTKDNTPRINFDALSLIREKITKSTIEINKQQLEAWLRGHDLEIKVRKGVVVLKFKEDLVGVGKSTGERIFNYLPKERKLKTPLPNG